MASKQQLIIVVMYIDMTYVKARQMAELREQMSQKMNLPGELAEQYFIQFLVMPVNSGDHRVECIFPKEQDESVKNKIEEYNKTLTEWIETMKQHQRQD